ncbi:MAG: hypothetical protein NXI24_03385 [bacterium]|nr:hypothetical protein [bacterium]
MNMRKYLRIGLIVLLPVMISGCFNIIHFVDVDKDGKVQVRWRMSVSSALAEMGAMQDGPEQDEPGLAENLDEAKERIEEGLKGTAEKVAVQKFENDQHQGIDVALTLKSLAAMNEAKLPEDEMPIVPIYDAKKKQLVFRFTPENTEQLKGADEEPEPESPEMESKDDADGSMEASDEDAMGPDAGEEDPMGGLEQLGEKLGQLFASAANYDIFIGSGMPVKEAYIRSTSGKRGDTIEIIPLGQTSMIRFPLLGMISDDDSDDGFEIVVQLKK